MNPNLQKILINAIARNALQIAVGFGLGLYWAAYNIEAIRQTQTLIAALAPVLSGIGGLGGITLSIFNSLGLWQAEPPEK